MKTKWNYLMVLVLLATLVGGSAGLAQAQVLEGISGVSPMEGTVGTVVTITGSGFGEKRGEVLLGSEKSKVLAWSDAEIIFMVDKPQHPDEYAITVLLQGDKNPAEPIMFEAFAMQRPRITSGELLLDGAAVTVVGAFFGDQKGALRLGYVEGQAGGDVVVADPKILDWSMNTIRFELPVGLTGQFVLAVRNQVGTGLAVLHLDGGMLGQVTPIPDWGGIEESWENANGIYYKGKFYVFSMNYNPGYDDNWRIEARTFDPSTGKFTSISPPKGETEAPLQPLVVGDTLWLFYSGHRWAEHICCEEIWYGKYTYNESTGTGAWDSAGWKSVPDVGIYEKATVAPVYDPINHRISVYYAHDGKLRWFYSNDFGDHWSDDALVSGELGGVPVSNDFIDAMYWPSATTTALVASTGQVVAVNNGQYRGSVGHLTDDTWRPSLVDLSGETALIYGNTPKMTKLNYGTWSWSGSTQLVYLPDTGVPLTSYTFSWAPIGAINKMSNTSGGYDRHLYVFYGVHLAEAYTEESLDRWYMHDEMVLGPEAPLPEIHPTVFTQVTAGEEHACAIKQEGTVVCWGKTNDGRLNVPAGAFSQISAGELHTCGVKTDKTVACWGWDSDGQVSKRPTDANYTQVTAGKWHSCALKTDGSVVCWGDNDEGRATPPPGVYFKQISSGAWHNCGIRKDNNYVQCWGDDGGTGRTKPPANTAFKQVSAAGWHTCGIKTDNTAVCWGDNDANRVSPIPAGTYIQVATGNWHGCGIKTDGSIACWGSNDDTRVSSRPTTGTFTKIEAGIRNTCAIRSDGAIVCWGNNSARQSLPPF